MVLVQNPRQLGGLAGICPSKGIGPGPHQLGLGVVMVPTVDVVAVVLGYLRDEPPRQFNGFDRASAAHGDPESVAAPGSLFPAFVRVCQMGVNTDVG